MSEAGSRRNRPVLNVEAVRCHFDVSGSWIQPPSCRRAEAAAARR